MVKGLFSIVFLVGAAFIAQPAAGDHHFLHRHKHKAPVINTDPQSTEVSAAVKSPYEEERVEAIPGSPPLETDDPGVPDNGEFEVNFSSFGDLSKEANEFDLFFVDANYGTTFWGKPLQLKLEAPFAGLKEKETGEPFQTGIGAAKFGLKYNFYNNEDKELSVSVYPQIEFNVPGAHSVEKGLSEKGYVLQIPILVSKEFKPVAVVGNLMYSKPLHSENPATGTVSVALGRAVSRKLVVMGEVRGESAFDLKRERLVFVNIGLVRELRENLMVYTKVGRSIFSDDGQKHTYAGIGVRVLVQTKKTAEQKAAIEAARATAAALNR